MMVDLLETYLSGKRKERELYRKEPKTYSYGGKIVEQDPLTKKFKVVYDMGTTPDEEPDYRAGLEAGITMYEKSAGGDPGRVEAFRKVIEEDDSITKEDFDQYKKHIPTVAHPTDKPEIVPSKQKETLYTVHGRPISASWNPKTATWSIGGRELTSKEVTALGYDQNRPRIPAVIENWDEMKAMKRKAGKNWLRGDDGSLKEEYDNLELANRLYGYLRKHDPEVAMEKYADYLKKKKGFSDKEIGRILSEMAFEFDIEIK